MNREDLLWSFIEDRAEKAPERKILTFENDRLPEQTLTYADIVEKGQKMAAILQENGIRKGDRFALLMPNYPEFILALWAASATGTVIVPIDPRSSSEKLAYQLKDSGAKGIFIAGELLKSWEAAGGEHMGAKVLGVVRKKGLEYSESSAFTDLDQVLSSSSFPRLKEFKQDVKAPFQVIYTSGTTGNPKGVVAREDRLALYGQLAKLVWQYREDDILYSGLSLTHGNAQAVTLIPALKLGVPAVFSAKFTKSRIWDICRRYGCTTFSLLGGMMMGIFGEQEQENDSLNPVRMVISAGTPPAIWREFESRFAVRILEWYGTVEGGFAFNPPGVGPVGSFGKPLPGLMEMKVVKEDDTDCEPLERGEIIFRLANGPTEVEYLGNQQASSEKTRGGWLRTGDIGHKDENGWFFFDFRIGGGLRRQGEFIQIDVIEKVLIAHPAVSEVCVYGIPAASGAVGESDLVAAIAFNQGSAVQAEDLFKLCQENLDNNLVPSYLQIVDEIPKTASEKKLDRLLRELFQTTASNVFKREEKEILQL